MMAEYFGGNGIDHDAPYKFLIQEKGWVDYKGMLIKPEGREIEKKEWECVSFLCDEWDYGYDPDITVPQKR